MVSLLLNATRSTWREHACALLGPCHAWTGYPKSQNEIWPAARWRLARRARWLAGRARAASQSQIYA